jgi:histidinol phosphatase-like enzyme (inositol monophosphatase family)
MTDLPPARIAELEAFTLDLTRAAGDVINPLFRADHGLADKGPASGRGFDPVTEADKGAEAAIRKLIASRYPDHGVIGEEYGEDRPDAEFVWVLDPVDGTRAFISGLPLWTTLIGLRHRGRTIVGAIAQPFLNEVFLGSAAGTRLVTPQSETALKVRPCPGLASALTATTDPYLFTGAEAVAWTRFRQSVKLARYGADAYAYAMVAMGRLDLVIETGLKCWDIEAAVPVLAGAGGLAANWKGEPVGTQGGQLLIIGDQGLIPEVTALLADVAR